MTLKKLALAFAAVAAVLMVNAAEYPVSNLAEFQEAVTKVVAGTSWEDGDKIVISNGSTIDCSSLSGTYAFRLSTAYLTVRSASGRPEDARFLGAGSGNTCCFLLNGAVHLTGVTVENFVSTGNGSAVHIESKSAWVDDCVFCGNTTGTGTLWAQFSGTAEHPYRNIVFRGNTATTSSSGCYVYMNGSAMYAYVYDCQFISNTCTSAATGSYGSTVYTSSADYENCLFEGNMSKGRNGHLFLNVDAHASHCTFKGNSGTAALRFYAPTDTATHCLFVSNNCVCAEGGDGTIRNSLCVGNTANYAFNSCVAVNCTVLDQTGGGFGGGRFLNSVAQNCSTYDIQGNGHSYFTNCVYSTVRAAIAPGTANFTGEGCATTAAAPAKPAPGITYGVEVPFEASSAAYPYGGLPQKSSYLVDHGSDLAGFTRKDRDLAGGRRVCKNIVDIGCYEYQVPSGLMLLLR